LVNYYELDKFMYINIVFLIKYVIFINNIKLFLLINWWVLILFVVVF
jgi:hypothetical protein